MVGWLDGWMIGWLDGWMVGWFGYIMSLVDKYTFESRSRAGCSNSDSELCRTECCRRFGVEDVPPAAVGELFVGRRLN
jgi:hypothetical protein